MILQALYEYYQRRKDELPPNGFELKEIKFIIVIDRDGNFIDLVDTREGKKGRQFLLPKSIGRSGANSWQTTFLLWDHYGYVLGHPKSDDEKSKTMAKKQNEMFRKKIEALPEEVKADTGVKAILSFYDEAQEESVKEHSNWEACAKIPGCNLTFRLDGEETLIPNRNAIVHFQNTVDDSTETSIDEQADAHVTAQCLITGERDLIARLHTATPILNSKSNAKIVAFQKNSGFDSYGKEQAFNAPISRKAEANYTTALRHLTTSPTNRVIIGDDTIIFWSQQRSQEFDLESNFAWYINDAPKDDPDRGIQAVKSLYEAVQFARLPGGSEDRFYVLALSPNAARIAVRFWRTGMIKEFAEHILQHFEDFRIVHGPNEPEHLSLYRILTSTALQFKMENVPPNLAGAVISSIIDATPYPTTLLQQCIRRIRAEQNVTRARAAILKAYFNRFNKIHNPSNKEITMALDPQNVNPGYRLGRLFSVLEKIQEDANPGINATIRDRFYGAASTSPVTVFSQLLKLKNHHLAKLSSQGRKVYFEKLIGEITNALDTFPAHLTLNEQALFSIGYYHQRQDFFTRKNTLNDNETSTSTNQ